MKTLLGTDPLPEVDGSAPLELLAHPRTIASAIAGWAARDGTAPALVSADASHTYFALAALVDRFAAQLAAAGIGPEHRVGLLVPPGIAGGELAVALASNTTLVPINPALKPDEVIEFAAVSRLHAIVFPRWLETQARSAMLRRRMTVFDAVRAPDGTLGLELLTAPAGSPAPLRPAVDTDVAVLLRSSGTTGTPKLIPVTHGNLSAMAETLGSGLWFRLTSVDRAACTAPLYYAAGLKSPLFVPLLLGATVVFPPPEQVFELAEWIDELAPTYLSCVAPAALQRMIERMMASPRQVHASSLRFVLCAASYLPEQTRATAEALLHVPVLEFYGLSESGVMAHNPAPPGKAKPGTVGLPVPGELLVVDANRQPVASGTVGEIMICGPTLMPGYVTNDDSAPYGLQGGWLLTGDLGRLDEDGYLTIVGRNKEVINRGGEKVFPYEIEKAMLEHPAVLEAAAFGVPHPRLGESVAAAVVLKSGSTVTPQELRQFLSERLAPFKLPRHVRFVAALPRGNTGKVLRRALTEEHAVLPHGDPRPTDDLIEIEIRDVWARLLGTQDIGVDEDFIDRGGDSLLATDMLLEVERLFGKPYPQAELSTLTIRKMAGILKSELECEPQLMTQLRTGPGMPLFFCHGDYSTRGIYAQKLAALLPDGHPVYVLHCTADGSLGSSIEEIARTYLKEVLRVAPRTPIIVGGYCNGGLAAWHLTHLLRQQGVEVAQLLLLETISLNSRAGLRSLARFCAAAGSALPGVAGQFMREKAMRSVWTWRMRLAHFTYSAARRKLLTALRWEPPPELQRESVVGGQMLLGLMSRYVPPALDVGVTCFIAQDGRHFDTDPTHWRPLAPQLFQLYVPGTHTTAVVSERKALAAAFETAMKHAAEGRRREAETGRPVTA